MNLIDLLSYYHRNIKNFNNISIKEEHFKDFESLPYEELKSFYLSFAEKYIIIKGPFIPALWQDKDFIYELLSTTGGSAYLSGIYRSFETIDLTETDQEMIKKIISNYSHENRIIASGFRLVVQPDLYNSLIMELSLKDNIGLLSTELFSHLITKPEFLTKIKNSLAPELKKITLSSFSRDIPEETLQFLLLNGVRCQQYDTKKFPMLTDRLFITDLVKKGFNDTLYISKKDVNVQNFMLPLIEKLTFSNENNKVIFPHLTNKLDFYLKAIAKNKNFVYEIKKNTFIDKKIKQYFQEFNYNPDYILNMIKEKEILNQKTKILLTKLKTKPMVDNQLFKRKLL
jgi:hypothetical protein